LGIASILYLKSPRAAKILCDFVEKEVSSNSKTTDMIILGRLLLESQENILILPTFSNVSQLNPQFRNFSGIKAIMNARTYFGGIFDSVSIGQYLLGIDSRNNRGIRRSFVVNKNHLVDPSKVRMRFNPSGAEVLDRNDNISYLYSLHIHSKDLKAFIFPFNYHYFQKALDNSMYGEKKGLDFGEIFRMVRSKMSQKFK
jgi:hypothetical protein